MMIDMQVTPTQPVPLRHFIEERMALPLEIRARIAAHPLDHRNKRLYIKLEIFGWSSALLLIVLRSGGHAVRPLERRIKSDPSHHISRQRVAFHQAYFPLADDRFERVVKMTNHLMRCHLSPTAPAVWRELSESRQKSLLVYLIIQ